MRLKSNNKSNIKSDVAIELKDLMTVAKEMNIKKPAAIIESVSKAVKDWKRYAKSAGVNESQITASGKSHLRF